ncbi:MAG: response regulator [Chitinivibrionales bacterium]|nr:response regulator [Chitinivibrionales bacterium]
MKTILIVDDDEIMRTMLQDMLAIEGYAVDCAPDGAVVQHMLKNQSYDLIVTDIVMPEKEGIETIIHIRKAHPDLPVIAISGGGRMAPGDYLEVAQGLGVNFTFAKPLDRKEFVAAVKSCLGE